MRMASASAWAAILVAAACACALIWSASASALAWATTVYARASASVCKQMSSDQISKTTAQPILHTFVCWALTLATESAPSSCLTLLLFSRSTFYSIAHEASPQAWEWTYCSLNLRLKCSGSEFVHCVRDITLELAIDDSYKRTKEHEPETSA